MTKLSIVNGYLDKVTIIGNMKREGATPHLLRFLGNSLDPRIVEPYMIDKYQYDRAVKIKTGKSTAFIQVSTLRVKVSDFRIEFNPSKCYEEDMKLILHLLSMVEAKRYTRIDLCLNFHTDLTGYQLVDNRRRGQVEYKGASGRLETLYRGSERSEDYIKLYDKKKQQKDVKFKDIDHDWWRLEETIQGDKAENYTEWEWFKGVKLVNGDPVFPEGIDPKDKGNAYAVLSGFMDKAEFKPDYRRKIQGIIDSVTYGEEFNVGEEIKKTSIVSETLEVLKKLLSD